MARNVNIDSAETTNLRRRIIEGKPFLKKIYSEWYQTLHGCIPGDMEGKILEIGSGAGFIKREYPDILTSDILHVSNLDIVMDAHRLPFPGGKLKAILMSNVLHHIPDVEIFFKEAARCVSPGGVIAMIEPWNTS